VDEVALIRDTISHYAPMLIAPLSIQIRRAGVRGGPEFFLLEAEHEAKQERRIASLTYGIGRSLSRKHPDASQALLPPRHHRPRRSPADKTDKFAPLHIRSPLSPGRGIVSEEPRL
jgi:hypothetical protein